MSVDRKHNFSVGFEEPDFNTSTREAFTSPPIALQSSRSEVVYRTNIPIGTPSSAFQQNVENNFSTSQKSAFVRPQSEKISR
jgi:hypothetical protein